MFEGNEYQPDNRLSFGEHFNATNLCVYPSFDIFMGGGGSRFNGTILYINYGEYYCIVLFIFIAFMLTL